MANFQRDGNMAFFTQGSRPNYLSSIGPIKFRERSVDLDKLHGQLVGNAVTFLSEIRPEDFNAPRKLWKKVFGGVTSSRREYNGTPVKGTHEPNKGAKANGVNGHTNGTNGIAAH